MSTKRFELESKVWGRRREVIVYEPPELERNSPTLFLLDGQSAFSAGPEAQSWDAERVADRLVQLGEIRPLRMVGLFQGPDRAEELTPSRDAGMGGEADRELAFLVDELIPALSAGNLRPVGLMGSSLGGLFALYAGFRYPERFDRVAALSPSLWWDRGRFLRWVRRWSGGPEKVWLDGGLEEFEAGERPGRVPRMVRNLRKLRAILNDIHHLDARRLLYAEIAGGKHREEDWRERVGPILQAFYG